MNRRQPSVKKNYIYNAIYQIFTMIVPLITTPYISKTLLPEGVGKYSYTYSIVSYFVLFAQLGFGYYAQREIAKNQKDLYKQSITFFEIMIVKTFSVGISLVIYCIMCFTNVFGEYTPLMWYWIFLILAQGVDIAFIFQGNEEFGKVVTRNLVIKILGIVSIFLFIKDTTHVWIYILSIALSNFLGALSTWIYLPKYICKVNRKDIHPLHHLKPTIQLFIPTIASVVYSYLDKTLIGLLIRDTYTEVEEIVLNGKTNFIEVVKKYSDLENGFYEQSEKIVKVGMSLLTALGAVMLPRNSKEYASGNDNNLKNNIYFALKFVFFIGCPIMLGLFAISENLIPWFLGNGFEKCILYMKMFCPLVILIGIDNVFGIQYLLTTGRDKEYTISIVSGTFSNIILNIILIPLFWGKGAIIASVLAELIILGIMYFFIRKEISIFKIINDSKKYIFSSLIMFIVVFIIQKYLNSSILNTMILIAIGAITYFTMLFIFRDDLIINSTKTFINKLHIK